MLPVVYIVPLAFGVVLGLALLVFIARQRYVPGVPALMALVAGATVWAGAYALEIAARDSESMLFWARVQYLGIVTVPLAWFFFSALYQETPVWKARTLRFRLALVVIPVLTLLLVWTNEAHGLIWREVQPVTIGQARLLVFRHGPWYWLQLIYDYFLLLFGSVWLLGRLFGSTRLYRWQVALAVAAVLVPLIANLLYSTRLNPIPHLDLTPFAFLLSGLLFTISLLRFHLVDLRPVAHQAVFEGQADCLIVLDAGDRVVDSNPAARALLPGGGNPAGRRLAEAAPELAACLEQAAGEMGEVELARGEGKQRRYYAVRAAPLDGRFPQPTGRLVVCHDITPIKQEQVRLEQAVAERTEALRQAVQQLQRELIERELAEKRFAGIVEAAPDALLVVGPEGRILLANAQAERLFGYGRDDLIGQSFALLAAPELRREMEEYLAGFLASPSVRLIGPDAGLQARRRDGSCFPVELSLGPLDTPGGVWAACAVRDTSARIQAEREQTRLLEEVRQSREELRALTFRLQELQETQSRQVAAELHDWVGQNLTALNLSLQLALNQLSTSTSAQVRDQLETALNMVEDTTRQVRGVMAELHPPVLDQFGLLAALRWYATDFTQRTGIPLRVDGEEPRPRLAAAAEMVLFRIAQEALNNAAKHARASQLAARLEAGPDAVCLVIEDDGRGFDPRTITALSEQPRWGIVNMQQRAASIGGQLQIESTPGRGTRLSVRVERGDG